MLKKNIDCSSQYVFTQQIAQRNLLFLMPEQWSEAQVLAVSPSHLFSSLHQKLLIISLFGFKSIHSQKIKSWKFAIVLDEDRQRGKDSVVVRSHQMLFLLNNCYTSPSVNCPHLAAKLWRRSPQITHTVSETPLLLVRSGLGEGNWSEANYGDTALRTY